MRGSPERPAYVTWLFAGAILLVFWSIFAFVSRQQFVQAGRSAFSSAGSIARTIETKARSVLGEIDQIGSSVEIHIAAAGAGGSLAAIMRNAEARRPKLIRAIDYLDAEGRLVASTRLDFEGRATRTGFQFRAPIREIGIGLPRPIDDKVLVPIRRELHGPNREPLGALVFELETSRLAGLDGDLGLPADAIVVLYRADGMVLAANFAPPPGSARDSALWRAMIKAPTGGFDLRQADGAVRLVAYRGGEASPIVVSVGFAARSVFAAGRRHTIDYGLIGVFFSVSLIVMAGVLQRQIRRRAETEQALALAAAAVTSVTSGVVIVDAPGGRIVHANPAFEQLTGRPWHAMKGQSWRVVTGFSNEATRSVRPDVTSEGTIERADGSTAWVELRGAPIRDANGTTTHRVLILSNIDQRRHAEDELVRAKDSAEAASRAKSDFLAHMSHELRTPLNAVIGFSDSIARQILGPVGVPRYLEYANDIRDAGAHLLAMISDILDLAKIESNSLDLDEQAIDVAQTLEACRRLLAAKAERKDVRIVVDCADALPAFFGDELRLKQIVLNLLGNAVKFSPRGSAVSMTARAADDGGIAIRIADRGRGMTEAQRREALLPFRHADSGIARQSEGAGLGLPLAARLAELHGGSLSIESAPDAGTAVTIRFPASRVRPRAPHATPVAA
jgi:PAS domain S-box-containing protein